MTDAEFLKYQLEKNKQQFEDFLTHYRANPNQRAKTTSSVRRDANRRIAAIKALEVELSETQESEKRKGLIAQITQQQMIVQALLCGMRVIVEQAGRADFPEHHSNN